jgi:hypothetical protein
MRPIHLCIWALLLAVIMALSVAGNTRPLLAHADDRLLQQEKVEAGLYQLTVWTAPTRLRTGEIHVETMIFDQAGNLDRKCAVFVTLTPLQPSLPKLSALSVPTAMDGLREAAFKVLEPGRYRVQATVVDESGEAGAVAFEVEIIRISPLIHLLLYLLLGASLVAGVWMLRQGLDLWFGVRLAAS